MTQAREVGMIDRLLEVGTCFDWISPVLAAVQGIANGPGHTFLFADDCGWSGSEVAGYLEDHGVKTWGHMVVDHTVMITVKETQARWSQYLLDRAGITLEGGAVEHSRSYSMPVRSRSPDSRGSEGWTDTLRDILNGRIF
jgi:hypothetical protein